MRLFVCILVTGIVLSQAVLAQQPQVFEPLTQEKLEQRIFKNTPEGCKTKLNLFTVGLHGYRDSKPVEEMGNVKIIQPFIQKIYDDIRAVGVPKATVNAMKEFQICAEKFQTAQMTTPKEAGDQRADSMTPRRKSYQERQATFFNSCGAMNVIALTAIDGVETQVEQAVIEERVAPVSIDATGTVLERAENPQKLVVSKIYDAAKDGGYDKAVDTGFGLLLQCFAVK